MGVNPSQVVGILMFPNTGGATPVLFLLRQEQGTRQSSPLEGLESFCLGMWRGATNISKPKEMDLQEVLVLR